VVSRGHREITSRAPWSDKALADYAIADIGAITWFLAGRKQEAEHIYRSPRLEKLPFGGLGVAGAVNGFLLNPTRDVGRRMFDPYLSRFNCAQKFHRRTIDERDLC
jgi:hypothetical protein